MKKMTVWFLVITLLIVLTGCTAFENVISGSTSRNTDAAGVYVYEKWEGEPMFNITYHIVTLNDDKTCHEKYEWVAHSMTQKTVQPGAEGTWELKDGIVTLTWNGGGSIDYELDKDRLKWTMETGYKTDVFVTVLFKKE